jgi:metal-responsive CopG/Arc/MetJ family transcriptional regulator
MAANVHTASLSVSLLNDLLKAVDKRVRALGYPNRAAHIAFLIEQDLAQGGDHLRVPALGRLHSFEAGSTTFCFSIRKTLLRRADRRAKQLGYRKRSHYLNFLLQRDLDHPGPHVRIPASGPR